MKSWNLSSGLSEWFLSFWSIMNDDNWPTTCNTDSKITASSSAAQPSSCAYSSAMFPIHKEPRPYVHRTGNNRFIRTTRTSSTCAARTGTAKPLPRMRRRSKWWPMTGTGSTLRENAVGLRRLHGCWTKRRMLQKKQHMSNRMTALPSWLI